MTRLAERRIAIIGGLTALVLAAPMAANTFVTPARADAVAPIVWCDDGYYLRTFSSGLTDTPHDFTETLTGVLADCSSPAGDGDPTVNGVATLRESGAGTGSCTNNGMMHETWQIEWANGRTSTIDVSTMVAVKGGKLSVLSAGTVTAGEFVGAKNVGIPLAVNDDVACGTPQGMTAAVGRISTMVLL
jgi:hypothetical protein